MELIPILSTIILAATAGTFLLAVGAYILYKIRERKGKRTIIYSPRKSDAELLAPAKIENEIIPDDLKIRPEEFKEMKRNLNIPLREKADEKEQENVSKELKESKKLKTKFLKYTSEGYISPKEDKNRGFTRWR